MQDNSTFRFSLILSATFLLTASALISSCSKEEDIDYKVLISPSGYDFIAVLQNMDKSKNLKSEEVITTEDLETEVGISVLHRQQNGLTINYQITDSLPNIDPAGHAVTLWALFISDESYPYAYGMYRLQGHVIGEGGNLNFAGHIQENSQKNLVMGSPLEDASNDIAVFFTRSHGPKNPDTMPAQIHTFQGGCEEDPDDGGPEGACYEFSGTVHAP